MGNKVSVALKALAIAICIAFVGQPSIFAQIPGGNGVTSAQLNTILNSYALTSAVPALAPVQSVNSTTGNVVVQPGTYIGTFTVATLPSCNGTTTPFGSYAYVSDLGGGANTARCVASSWQHYSLGIPSTNVTASGTVTITPLQSAPVQILTGNILTTLTVTISTSNLYAGYILYVSRPGLLTGSINIGVSGTGTTLPLLGSTRSAYIWDGAILQQIQ